MATARFMGAGEFKAKCLELMDSVAESGDVIVITKRGKPVAQLTPLAKPPTRAGYFKEKFEFVGDVITPVELDWGPAEPKIAPTKRSRRGAGR
jgi:prevent-host-death family protein